MNAHSGSIRPLNRSIAALAALVLVVSGCKSNKEETAAPPAAEGGSATAAVTQTSWAPDALEELVAPIALYPDPLVGQILAASVNTQEVLDAGNWLLENQSLKGDALDAAAAKAGFGPATRSLVQFPTVMDMMCQELDWTKQLGAAVTSDQKGVLDAIQRLRTNALNVGNLKTGPQQTVETKSENGRTIVEVKPTNPKVVYVPQYDPAVVYTTPPTTTTVQQGSSNDAALAGLIGFGLGIAIGVAISDNYCYPHYGYGAVYVGPRPFYPPAYAYRPVYSPAFRPAYGYRPPANYVNNYHRGNTNIVINNNNYYNRFDHNSNLKGQANSPLAGNNKAAAGGRDQVANRAATGGSSKDWKGQSSYKGAKPGGSKTVRDAQAKVGDTAARKPAGVDRGYGASNRAGATKQPTAGVSNGPSQPAATQRAGAADARVGSGSGGVRHEVDAGTGANVLRSSGSTPRASGSDGGSAFSGGSERGSGSFDRAASARGHASTSSSGHRSGGGGGGFRR